MNRLAMIFLTVLLLRSRSALRYPFRRLGTHELIARNGAGADLDRDDAIDLLYSLHKAQNEFYAGSGAALAQLLAPNIMWTVPGDNRIAGTYRGLEEVFGYFRLRRDLADHTFQMKRRDVLVGEGNRVAALTDGFATIRGSDHRWSTVGLYDVIDRQIAACWLLPLDQRVVRRDLVRLNHHPKRVRGPRSSRSSTVRRVAF
jgi:ketosteroid isomerase-like protein